MEFEWDEGKRAANAGKHGIDFIDAQLMFDGRPVVVQPSSRGGEARWKTTGQLDGRLVTVVWTWRRGGTVRLISARRAHGDEQRAYRQVHG